MPPSTAAIVGSLPPAKAGVGSAVNDVTREVGGALGIAVMGSVVSALYRSDVASTADRLPVRVLARSARRDQLGMRVRSAIPPTVWLVRVGLEAAGHYRLPLAGGALPVAWEPRLLNLGHVALRLVLTERVTTAEAP